jgi:hypothetical protein
MNDVSQLSSIVSFVIDRTIDITCEGTRVEGIDSSLMNDALIGGPTCTYKGIETP